MTSNKREKAIKYFTEEIRSLRMAPQINGCGPENWADQLEIMETCLQAVRSAHFAEAGKMRPLNLCALKEMEKQVVFVDVVKKEFSRICDLKSQFGVVRPEEDRVHLFNGRSVYFTSYGAWLAYHPANIDREAWSGCEACKTPQCFNCFHSDLSMTAEPCNSCVGEKWETKYKFCPECGRPITPEAWAELEKRLRG